MFCIECGNELPEYARFCGKCGTPVQDVSISTTTETVMQQTETTVSVEAPKSTATPKKKGNNIIQKYLSRWERCKEEKFKGLKNRVWIVVNSLFALLLLWNLILCFICNRELNGIVYWVEDGKAIATNVWLRFSESEHLDRYGTPGMKTILLGDSIVIKRDTVRIGFKNYEVAGIEMEGGMVSKFSTANTLYFAPTYENAYAEIDLSAMPQLETLEVQGTFADVYIWSLTENNDKLHRISVANNSTEPVGDICIHAYEDSDGYRSLSDIEVTGVSSLCMSGNFPALTSLTTSCIVDSGSYYTKNGAYIFGSGMNYTAEQLNHVTLNITNNEIIGNMEKYRRSYEPTDDLSSLLSVENLELNISHTIDDLYGTWNYTDENGNTLLLLTIQDNGYVRVSDGLGLLGGDLFTFSELDENTLLLKAETENLLGQLVTVEMPYQIFGDQLSVSLFGTDIVLLRE